MRHLHLQGVQGCLWEALLFGGGVENCITKRPDGKASVGFGVGGDFKFGFSELFDEKLYITPHPSPVAFAGRHLPPEGKASDTATLKII